MNDDFFKGCEDCFNLQEIELTEQKVWVCGGNVNNPQECVLNKNRRGNE